MSRARELHVQARWDDACAAFLAIGGAASLHVEDVERLAEAAQMCGRHDEAVTALERSFALRVVAGDLHAAATTAFWLFTEFLYGGEMARAGGWVERLRDLAEEAGGEGMPGWLLVAGAYRCIGQEQYGDAREMLAGAIAQGRNRDDVDLVTFATMLTGRSLLKEGRIDAGIGRLDEAMLHVTSAETSPRVTSSLFCSGIGTCEEEALDFARSREWALALERWLSGLPSPPGTLLNNCRVYRAVLLRRRGEVQRALDELQGASHALAEGPGVLVAGHACYELGETHRLLGNDREAEAAYRRAASLGESTQPGLALLRLRQGDTSTAEAGIRRALAEADRPQDRARLLPAAVTILLAAGETADARASTAELGHIADTLGSTVVRAGHAAALGEVALAEGDPASSLPCLRRAAVAWRELIAPYEVACTGVRIAQACKGLGDEEGSRLELDAARVTFANLGARCDLVMLDNLLTGTEDDARGLTHRERQVLALVVEGLTSKAIAAQLFLSERTVHRHLSNIFSKLEVGSRTEAAAYAIQHHLIR